MSKTTFILSDKVYSVLKWIAQIFLPATATLYFALATTWNLPHPQEIVATITTIDTFLGVLLGISSRSYSQTDLMHDGSIFVDNSDDGGLRYQLALNGDPAEIQNKDTVSFKVANRIQ